MTREPALVTAPPAHHVPVGSRRRAPALPLLQHAAGNRAVQRLLTGIVLQRACDCGTCEKCQARRGDGMHEPVAAPDGILSGKGSGQPLGEPVRDFMESRFGHDFGQVRVHTDGHAARSASQISALAYTAGTDVFFAPGQYRPDTDAGRHLLAHELTHVIQQGGGAATTQTQTQLTVGEPDDRYEREADQVADAVMAHGGAPSITPLAWAPLQRKKFVTGSFIGAGKRPRTMKVPLAWNAARNAFESVLEIEAEFTPEPGRPCAAGRVVVFGKGWASRAAGRVSTVVVHVDPEGRNLGGEERKLMTYVAQVYDCRLRATVALSIRADQADDTLDGNAQFRAVAYDAFQYSDPEEAPEDRMSWQVDFKNVVPKGFKPVVATPQESKARAGSRESKAGEKKEQVKGHFTSIPSGTLKAHFVRAGDEEDVKEDGLRREFQMNARFEPAGGATDCTKGEYRQFVKVYVERDGKVMTQKELEAARELMYSRMCEDRGHDAEHERYGHRKFNESKAFGTDGKSCLYYDTDAPFAPLGRHNSMKMKDEFVGQLIDLGRIDPAVDEPLAKGTDGLLAHSEWTVEGEYPAPEVKASRPPVPKKDQYDDKPDKGYDRARREPLPPEYLQDDSDIEEERNVEEW
jgi:hypothetical protein